MHAFLLLALLLAASLGQAAVIRVPQDQSTLQAAFQTSQPGDTVAIQSPQELWEGSLQLDHDLAITSESHLQGGTPAHVGSFTIATSVPCTLTLFGVEMGSFTLQGHPGGSSRFRLGDSIISALHAHDGQVEMDRCSVVVLELVDTHFACGQVHFTMTCLLDMVRSTGVFSRCTFSNILDYNFRMNYSEIRVENCSIHGNDFQQGWGGYAPFTFQRSSHLTVIDSIIADNMTDEFHPIFEFQDHADDSGAGHSAVVLHSCLEDGQVVGSADPGAVYTIELDESVIGDDPQFASGFQLSPTSPCIDRGDPASPLDPDGTPADMGAWYFCQATGFTLPGRAQAVTEPLEAVLFPVRLDTHCDDVAILAAQTGSGLFQVVDHPGMVPGRYQSGEIVLRFQPVVAGVFRDTLQLELDVEPFHVAVPLLGESDPQPVPVADLAIEILPDLSARLSWSPVTETVHGSPLTPDYYLVYYNEQNPTVETDWYYQGASSTTGYTHFLAARFAPLMNYRVLAWKGLDPVLAGCRPGRDRAGTGLGQGWDRAGTGRGQGNWGPDPYHLRAASRSISSRPTARREGSRERSSSSSRRRASGVTAWRRISRPSRNTVTSRSRSM